MTGFQNDNPKKSLDQFVTIELFGQPYTFKAEDGSPRAREIADFLVKEVNKVEDQLSGKSSNLTKQAILILTALNIASENFELKKYHSHFAHQVSERATNILHLLETNLQ